MTTWSRRWAIVASLALVAGCSTSRAAPPTAPRPSDAADRPPVLAYAKAPARVRAVLEHSGLEPEVESAGSKLAIGRHVVVAGDVDDPLLYQMALIGDLAVDEVERLDGRTFDGQLLILAPATRSEYVAWGGDGYEDTLGVTRAPTWDGDHSVVTLDMAQRGFTQETLADDGDLLRHVIAHETFHALTLPVGGIRRAPLWLVEGFAEVAANDMRMVPYTRVPRRASLPTTKDFHSEPGAAYFLAWQFASFVVHREGRRRAMRFYFADVSRHHGSSMDRLSKEYLGAALPWLVRRWELVYARARLQGG